MNEARRARSPFHLVPTWILRGAVVLSASLWLAPGAVVSAYEGFGTTTPGGAGGEVVRVTNLDDSGPGSLREALAQGNRTIVFDVAGEIVLTDFLFVTGAYVTIDGFSAPSPGITLRNWSLVIQGIRGAHDVIVRGIRVRDSANDGIMVKNGAYNVVIDHVSVAGSLDGNIDITADSHDVTVSWSILAGNVKNMLIKYNASRVTLHHNLFVSAQQRSPYVSVDDQATPASDITADIRNNLIWGWGSGYGTWINNGGHANVVNNFYSAAGGDAPQALVVDSLTSGRAYTSGNVSADGVIVDAQGTETSPFPATAVTTDEACIAAREVLAGAGVRPLDLVDEQYVQPIDLPPCSNEPQTVRLQIAAATDDASEYTNGVVKTGETSLKVGRYYRVAFRFVGVPIPPNATIGSAVLSMYGVTYMGNSVNIKYYGEAVDDSPPLLATTRNLSNRPQTLAVVYDVPGGWAAGTFNDSPDLASIIQEIVSRPGWGTGNNLTLFVADNNSIRQRVIGSFDRSSTAAAFLDVTFTSP